MSDRGSAHDQHVGSDIDGCAELVGGIDGEVKPVVARVGDLRACSGGSIA